jgi:hypothetical protein
VSVIAAGLTPSACCAIHHQNQASSLSLIATTIQTPYRLVSPTAHTANIYSPCNPHLSRSDALVCIHHQPSAENLERIWHNRAPPLAAFVTCATVLEPDEHQGAKQPARFSQLENVFFFYTPRAPSFHNAELVGHCVLASAAVRDTWMIRQKLPPAKLFARFEAERMCLQFAHIQCHVTFACSVR